MTTIPAITVTARELTQDEKRDKRIEENPRGVILADKDGNEVAAISRTLARNTNVLRSILEEHVSVSC